MLLKRIQYCILGLLLFAGVSACSDGGGETPAPATTALSAHPAEGLWIGVIPNVNPNMNRAISGLVLDDGVYWILYSTAGDPSILEGLIQGSSSSQNGLFTSSDTKDFNLGTGLLAATITGTYSAKQSLNGTIVYPQNNTQSTFTTTYDSDYELVPNMDAVAGTYTGLVTASESATITVTSTGGISGGTSTGCLFTGTFSPRAHGNVFNVTITFGAQPACTIGPEAVNGIGYYDAGTKQLTSAALTIDKTDGFVFIGTKNP
jgi:hypothetical protein